MKKKKHTLYLIATIICITFMVACSDDKPPVDPGQEQDFVSVNLTTSEIINPFVKQGVIVEFKENNLTVNSSNTTDIKYVISGHSLQTDINIASSQNFTLTLDNTEIGSIIITSESDATIIVKNDNTISGHSGISSNGSIILQGAGKLDITTTTGQGIGLISSTKNITISECGINIHTDRDGIKGIYAAANVVINSGYIDINLIGKSYLIGSDSMLVKGIRASNITINDGIINIYVPSQNVEEKDKLGAEGIKAGDTLTINGGLIDIVSGDDCLNAGNSWGNTGYFFMNGGTVYCKSIDDDGIDCNGTMECNGGFVIATGREESYDVDNMMRMKGGTYVGVAHWFHKVDTANSTQYSILYYAQRTVCIKNDKDEVLLMYKFPENITEVSPCFFSSDKLVDGEYTVFSGGQIVGGAEIHGYYTGATYVGGSSKKVTINKKHMVF